MDASFGAVLNNSPQRHSIIISPPEEWVVGLKEKDSRAPPLISPIFTFKRSLTNSISRKQLFCLGHLSTSESYFVVMFSCLDSTLSIKA